MKTRIVPVKNITRLSTASKALVNRAAGAPGIGLISGDPGYGKSTATAWMSNQMSSIYVRAFALWTPASMLSALCRELRLPSGGSCAAMVERVIEALSRGGQTVFIDEGDYIVNQKRLVETLRDLHDSASVPIILIGANGILEKLTYLRQFTSRIAEHVEFQALDLQDTSLIAKELCEIEVKPDLVDKIHRDTRGNCRNIVVSLSRAEQIGRGKGASSVGVDDIGKKSLFSGDAPQGGR